LLEHFAEFNNELLVLLDIDPITTPLIYENFFTFEITYVTLYVFYTRVSPVMITYKKFMCVICGYIYDEAEGWPEDGIAAGTLWADVPENWFCPDCGASKDDFEMLEL